MMSHSSMNESTPLLSNETALQPLVVAYPPNTPPPPYTAIDEDCILTYSDPPSYESAIGAGANTDEDIYDDEESVYENRTCCGGCYGCHMRQTSEWGAAEITLFILLLVVFGPFALLFLLNS
ncbi:uncharacterized protein LOC100368274 [Saccoglossus kowalevskii]|uniref:Uncharacterized protein LOC100368274 n=1 Tax=Saccoglossus kowalevskii TaxID=10224 RepID=A0ABM0GP34_SACKO|nr:PREDICTED: uncharacterized protein LOC100368274 [Saccoglossus kowalevskii]